MGEQKYAFEHLRADGEWAKSSPYPKKVAEEKRKAFLALGTTCTCIYLVKEIGDKNEGG